MADKTTMMIVWKFMKAEHGPIGAIAKAEMANKQPVRLKREAKNPPVHLLHSKVKSSSAKATNPLICQKTDAMPKYAVVKSRASFFSLSLLYLMTKTNKDTVMGMRHAAIMAFQTGIISSTATAEDDPAGDDPAGMIVG